MANNILKLAGNEIPVKNCFLAHIDLKFYPENPRIYSIVCAENNDPSQNEIQSKLEKMDHVKQLVQSIKANDGLLDALIVRDGDYVVLEGNSRLAAYRLLSKNDPIKWGKVQCRLLPKNIEQSLVFALLGQYHIVGRKDWAPYEQAGYLWRRWKNHKAEPGKMAKEMGISAKRVDFLIEVFSFMVDNNDMNIQHWSYYDEYLKSRKINSYRKECKAFDQIIVKKIKSGEISKAVDVRDKVSKVVEAGGKTLTKFVQGKKDLEESYESAMMRGMGNVLYKHLNRFRIEICDPDTKKELKHMLKNQLDKCKYEIRKIKQQVDKLLDSM